MSPLAVVVAGPYNLFYTLAVAAAAASMFLAGRRRGWNAGPWGLAVVAWAVAGMVGAMLPHVIFGDAIAYRTSVGAVIFASLALGLIARTLRRDTADVLDTTAVAIPIGAAIVRVGCFLVECCQGVATSLPIGVALHADDVPRHPVQLYESVLEASLAVLIARRTTWSRPGRKFITSLGAMCAIRFVTELVRDNDKYSGLSLAQWVMLPIGLLCLILAFSRPRARKPQRVLTAGARQATIGVIGGLAIAAMLVGLPALESTVLLIGAAVILVAAIRRLGRMAPTGLAVLALQMPPITADSTYPRVYRFLGAGANMGSWDFVHRYADCEGTVNEEWSRHHSAKGASFELGSRYQLSATHSRAIRGRAYYGTDNVGAAVVKRGTPTSPGGFSHTSSGAQIVGDADWKWIGLSLGFSAGTFYPMFGDFSYGEDERFSSIDFFPAIGIRVGPLRGVSVETRIGDESPMWVPGPSGTAAFAIGDGAGNRFRIGASDVGLFLAAQTMTKDGLEVLPTFVISSGGDVDATSVFSGGITFRKWFRGARRPPAER